MRPMGVTHESVSERPAPAGVDNKPDFPHVVLNEKHLQKLGLKELPKTGTAMKMGARVEVAGAMMNDGPHGSERMLHLRITHMDLAKGGEHEETDGETKGEKLYGGKKEI